MVAKDYVEEVMGSLFDGQADPQVRVVGLGGCGSNVVAALAERELQGMETVVVNADRPSLDRARADVKVLLEPAEASEEGVAAAAEQAAARIREAVAGDIVFVVAGLGGATGTGAVRPLCRLAREAGAVVLAIAIVPFAVEANRRERGERLIQELRADCDSVLVVDNESMFKFDGVVSLKEAFGLVNRMVCRLVAGVLEQIQRDFYTTLVDEVETVARSIEQQAAMDVPVNVVVPPEVVEARSEISPVAFDATGFIGWK